MLKLKIMNTLMSIEELKEKELTIETIKKYT